MQKLADKLPSSCSASLELAQQLVEIASVTPDGSDCLDVVSKRLAKVGFHSERFDAGAVSNLWATYGDSGPLLVFVGHVDVVPPGDLQAWRHDPFEAVLENGRLYGRGTSDMKGGIASFLVAVERFLQTPCCSAIRIGVLLTSDEEGPAIHGTRHVVQQLVQQGYQFDYCIIGEPTSDAKLGDVIKNGRRGSIIGTLTIQGKVGHTGYPENLVNPIAGMMKFFQAVSNSQLEVDFPGFGRNLLQVTTVVSESAAVNMTPASCEIKFNIRHTPALSVAQIEALLHQAIPEQDFECNLDLCVLGNPYQSANGPFADIVGQVINERLGIIPKLSTEGGGSDGRFIALLCGEIVELGHINTSIHKPNEHVSVEDLEKLSCLYQGILERIATQAGIVCTR